MSKTSYHIPEGSQVAEKYLQLKEDKKNLLKAIREGKLEDRIGHLGCTEELLFA